MGSVKFNECLQNTPEMKLFVQHYNNIKRRRARKMAKSVRVMRRRKREEKYTTPFLGRYQREKFIETALEI